MAVGGCLIKSKWGKGWTENDWIWWKKMQNELFYCLSADLWPPHCRLLVFFGHLEIKTNYLCGYRRPENILHLLLRPACSLLPTFLRWLQPVKSTESLWISWQGLRRLLTCRVRCRLFTRRWRPFSQPPWPPLKAPFYGSLMAKAGPTRCAAVKKRLVPGSRQLRS